MKYRVQVEVRRTFSFEIEASEEDLEDQVVGYIEGNDNFDFSDFDDQDIEIMEQDEA